MTKKTDLFTFDCVLRWSDLDAQGHVNNALLLSYLQEARVALFETGDAASLLGGGVVVVSHQVTYRRAIQYSEQGVRIELGISHVGASRFDVIYWVYQFGKLVAEARTRLCPIDFLTGLPQKLNSQVKEHLRSHAVEAESLEPVDAPPLNGGGHPVEIPARWTDLDRYAHVNNAVVFDYVQQARVTSTVVWDPEMARAGERGSQFIWLVARQDVQYLAQLDHGIVTVRTAPVRIGGTSLTLAAEIEQGGKVCVRAQTVVVCADWTGKPQPLPDSTRSRLQQHLVS